MSRLDFEKEYKNLNKHQKKAVDAIEGPVMVIAGPGTGKTTILTLRIANILLKTDANPENILALTFTNSGVTAMRNKLVKLIGDDAYRVNIFTFHSFAENIMREFSFYFRDLEGFKVITDLDKVKIIEEIIKQGSFKEIVSDFDLFSSLKQIKNSIDKIKFEGLDPEEFRKRIPAWKQDLLSDEKLYYKKKYGNFNAGDIKPNEEKKVLKYVEKSHEIAEVFEKYQEIIKEKGFYDFSDMILNVLKELESNEDLKLDLQERYQYLLVDEHQDTNDGQNRIIELLTDAPHLNKKPNIFTVGDEKQSIYRFQGASDETFNHFFEIYDDILKINLTDNYRSTQTILDSSHDLIAKSVEDSVQLQSFKKEDSKINVLDFSGYKFELLFLANNIEDKIKSGVDPKEIAVIYRSNKHVDDVKNIFNDKKIPHTIISKENILDDKNISNLIILLRVIYNPNDNHNLAKALLIDFLNFDSYKILGVLSDFNKNNRDEKKHLFKYLEQNESFKKLTEIIKELKTHSENSTFGNFFKVFLEETGYLKFMLDSSDSKDQLIKIDKLFDEIKRQSENYKNYNLSDFIKFIDSYKKYNLDIDSTSPDVIEGVKLMTAHKSKGLEFEYVYIINTTSRNWEKSRNYGGIKLPIEDYKGDVDDERRLFYVAMTRAKKGLYITSALKDWEGKDQEKSRFISEIDDSFINQIDTSKFEKDNIENLSVFFKKINVDNSVWDKDYLKNLFLETTLNVTALNNYVDCPIRYLFKSLIKLPSEYKESLLFGNLVHEALEKFFIDSNKAGSILEKDLLLNYYKKAIDNSSMYGDEYNLYLKKGENALSEYFDQYHESWLVDIETEKYIKRDFKLDSGNEIKLSGVLDKIEYTDSTKTKINIIDYKTGKPFSDKSKKSQKEDLRRQIIFYHILMEGYSSGDLKIEKAILDFIQKNKKGEFEQHSIEVSDKDLEEVLAEINKMASEIISGEFLENGCDKKDCEFCHLKRGIK